MNELSLSLFGQQNGYAIKKIHADSNLHYQIKDLFKLHRVIEKTERFVLEKASCG